MSVAAVRLAVIGAGRIGVRHARLAAAEPACALVAIADPDPAAAALAAEVGAAHYERYGEMLDAVRPDGVIVAVPTGLHAEVGIACAAQGVHLLIEKPIADSLAAGRRLVAAAEAAGVGLAVGHHRRFDPAVRGARDIVRGGGIGTLLAVSVTWAVRKPDAYFDLEWRRLPGGGPVLINLIHDIDSVRTVCGEIERVYAETGRVGRGLAVEDTAAIVMRLAGGALCTVTASDAAPSPWGWETATGDNPSVPATGADYMHLFGSEGALEFPSLARWRHAGGAPGDWEHALRRETRPPAPRAALAAQLRHLCRMIAEGAPPMVDGREGLATLAATVAVLQSAERGAAVAPEAV
jgi:predicted dehydrogenase